MILSAAADVATIRHIARAPRATSHGVAIAMRGRLCAGNATDHGMNSKIAASSSQDTEVLVAMVDLSDDTAILPILSVMRTATEHSLDQDNALLQSMQAIRLLAGAVNLCSALRHFVCAHAFSQRLAEEIWCTLRIIYNTVWGPRAGIICFFFE